MYMSVYTITYTLNFVYSGYMFCIIYRIAGNFGEVFNLANWRFYGKSPNLKF